jgi:energy-coupling factor transporter ATP-binding protein EcfA2
MNPENDKKLFAIRRLEANEIGPFAHLAMDFPEKKSQDKAEIHILTGENGTGKSTVLQMLANCIPNRSQLLEKKMWSFGKAKYTLFFSDDTQTLYNYKSMKFEWQMANGDGMYQGVIHYDKPILSPTLDKYAYVENQNQLNTAFFAYSGYRKLSDSTVRKISEPEVSPFENALDFDKSTDAKTFVNWLANTITKNAIAYTKKKAEDRDRAFEYYKPIAQLEEAIADITGWQIEFELQESPLAILIHVNEQPLEFDQLPDGLKSMVSWLGDLLMRLDRIKWETSMPINERNFILFLDEIEIHLHPAWQRKILPVVQRLFPNAQIFISTHSPFVVGSVDGAWVYQFVKDEQGHSQIRNNPFLSEDSYSYDYILAEVFGITEKFGIDIQRDLQEFKTIKNQILRSTEDYDAVYFQELTNRLMEQSAEVQSIIGMELRQLSRLTNQTFA